VIFLASVKVAILGKCGVSDENEFLETDKKNESDFCD
jgi:hypothetical protein